MQADRLALLGRKSKTAASLTVTLHAIQRLFEKLVGDGRARPATAYHASEAFLAHQSLDCAASHGYVLSLQLSPHFACAIGSEVLLPHTPNCSTQLGITLCTPGNALRIALAGLVFVVG